MTTGVFRLLILLSFSFQKALFTHALRGMADKDYVAAEEEGGERAGGRAGGQVLSQHSIAGDTSY